ncbi:MAG: hypothetical protein ACKOTF_12375 [Opitutaceae bacterium]
MATLLAVATAALLCPALAFASSAKPAAPDAVNLIRIDGAIGLATASYVERAVRRATETWNGRPRRSARAQA